MPECGNCSQHVSSDFQRVFGGNDGDVHGCPDCMDARDIARGETASHE